MAGFSTIDRLQLPFRLAYIYIMCKDAVSDELLSPPGLGKKLVSLGLVPIDITIEEFELAQVYGEKYRRLSRYDRIALAIAKTRNITLMSGDGALRKAAHDEKVQVIRTIGILDRLFQSKKITAEEYRYCLEQLLENEGRLIRLPEQELRARLVQLSKE